jgi:hypothetical protein
MGNVIGTGIPRLRTPSGYSASNGKHGSRFVSSRGIKGSHAALSLLLEHRSITWYDAFQSG